MSADTPAKDQDKFVLRLPDGMRDRLKAAAEANKRSMNAEIVDRLEFTFEIADRTTSNPEQVILKGLLAEEQAHQAVLRGHEAAEKKYEEARREYEEAKAAAEEQTKKYGEVEELFDHFKELIDWMRSRQTEEMKKAKE